MTKKKKIIIGVAVAVFVVAAVFIVVSLIQPKNNNPYFEVTEKFTATKQTSFDNHIVSGKIRNKTNNNLDVKVTIDTNSIMQNRTFNLEVPANSTVTISNNTIDWKTNIRSVVLEVDGRVFTYNIDSGGGSFSNGPPFFIFIPFMIIPAIIIISIIIAATRGSFGSLSTRLQDINSRIEGCTQTQERERLNREKQRIESELAKFTTCEYCGAKNSRESLKCHGCGANTK